MPPFTISVVIPVKDDADELRMCLRALARQTLAPDEIVVIDNDSSDDTAAVARAAGARVVPFSGRGIPAAASAGYDVATGDVIARLDADCVPSPTWVAAIRDAFARDPAIGAITAGARFIDGPAPLRRVLAAVYLGAYFATTRPLFGHTALFGSNMAMRRTAWEDVRFVVHRRDRHVHDDFDLSYHLGERHRIRYEPSMRMGISMRPFADATSMVVRLARGMYTVLVHFPRGGPPWRWMRRFDRFVAGLLSVPLADGVAPPPEQPQPTAVDAPAAHAPAAAAEPARRPARQRDREPHREPERRRIAGLAR